MRAAFAQCRSIRTPRVLIPRSTSQASNGPATAPIAFWWKARSSPSVGIGRDQGAADHVRVAAEVLRRRVHDDVGPEFERLLQVRRGERVVDDEPRAGLVRDRRQRRDVGDAEQRVRRRLAPDDLGLGTHRGAHRVEVGERHRRVLEPPVREHPRDQPERSAVRVAGQDHVIARAGTRRAARCPRRRARTRTPARASRPRAPRAPPPARCGSGSRCGCTRSRRAARRRRPACRWTSHRSAPRPRRCAGPAPARHGWLGC